MGWTALTQHPLPPAPPRLNLGFGVPGCRWLEALAHRVFSKLLKVFLIALLDRNDTTP